MQSNQDFFGMMGIKYLLKSHKMRGQILSCLNSHKQQKMAELMGRYVANHIWWSAKLMQDVKKNGVDKIAEKKLYNYIFNQYLREQNLNN